MIRSIVILAPLALSGCLNWQGTYDSAARQECAQIMDPDDRRACLAAIEENSSQKRAEKRGS